MRSGEYRHVPVLYEEVLEGLAVKPGGVYIDGTVGGGGHARGILERSAPESRLLGIDADPAAIEASGENLKDFHNRITLLNDNFRRLEVIASEAGFASVDGVLLDLGVSSWQLAEAKRGFSFLEDGPLDMRFDPGGGVRASDLVNERSEQELADIFFTYGEERRSRKLAKTIVAARPIYTTRQLAQVVERAVGKGGRIHPATRIFQALRIAVNQELEALKAVLPQAAKLLRPGGRLAIISFHSLEDRIVKRYMQRESKDCLCPPNTPTCICGHRAILKIITRKVITPSADEIDRNPRSRSARLRIAEKL
ncbi:MAG: 16S rRNA (cytosine(1402)-N(4))-methyltransferase RsmH [Chloroflexi bacterium]|nr:16S rRNA (cytosine(1402)-N(4))-methyltransferase RsmH [Chloroflexota bacterium]